MSDEKRLNQDEIDALLNGVDTGTVSTEPEAAPGAVRPYDFSNQMVIVRGRMPTLDMINERFVRLFRVSLQNLLRRAPEIDTEPVQMKKYSDYIPTLHVPTSLNLVRFNPLRGTSMFVLDPKLVFALVDNFFGGSGRHAKIEGRDFTATEQRVIHLLLRSAFSDLREAWSNIAAIDIEFTQSEINPQFANIVSGSEIVVVSTFHIELEGGRGDLHITMPYSMLEPLREVLSAGGHADHAEQDSRWATSLREEVNSAEVELTAVLGQSSMSMGDLLNLKPGDVIACDFTGRITLVAEGVPVFRGSFGASRGQHAAKIDERIRREKPVTIDQLMPKKG